MEMTPKGLGNTPGPSIFQKALPNVLTAKSDQLFAVAARRA